MLNLHGDQRSNKDTEWTAQLAENPYMQLDDNGVYWINDSVPFAKSGAILGRNSHIYARENFARDASKAMLTWNSESNIGHQADEWMRIRGLILNGRRGQVAGNDYVKGVDFMGPNIQGHARLDIADCRTVLMDAGWDMMNTQYNRLENLEAALCRDGFRFWNHPRWGGATDQPARQMKAHQCDHAFLFVDVSRGDLGYPLPMNGTVWRDVYPRESHNNHFVFDSLSQWGPHIIIDGGSSEYLDTDAQGQPITRTYNVPDRADPVQFEWKRAPVYLGNAVAHFKTYHFNDNQPAGANTILMDKAASRLILEHSHGGGPDSYFIRQEHIDARAVYYGDVFTYGVMEGVARFPDGWMPWWGYSDNQSCLIVGPAHRYPRADGTLPSMLHPQWVPAKPAFSVTNGTVAVTTRGVTLSLNAGGVAVSKWLRGFDTPSGEVLTRPTPSCFNLWVNNIGSGQRCHFWLEHYDGQRMYGGGPNSPVALTPGWNRVCIPMSGNAYGDVPDLRVRIQCDKAIRLALGEVALTYGNESALRAALHFGARGE